MKKGLKVRETHPNLI